MPPELNLITSPMIGTNSILLRLQDGKGCDRATHAIDLIQFTNSEQQALFNLRDFVRLYKTEAEEAAAVADTGVLIALRVLGKDIFRHLYAGKDERLLRIVLPAADGEQATSAFTNLLTRIPWEIARPSRAEANLNARNLRVCIVHPEPAPSPAPIPARSAINEALRVLFVFAESRGSIPLGMRQERRALQALFQDQIDGKRDIVAHFLAHGVTRAQLAEQIRAHGGYHIVHWSGHGQRNMLELAAQDGAPDHITGQELLALFQQPAGLIPHLFFLSACHSGDSAAIHNWDDFLPGHQRGSERNPATNGEAATRRDGMPATNIGPAALTSTAQALLAGGVPSVVAMRFAVGDDYARELALGFYTALLADATPKSVATALKQARKHLLKNTRFSPCDHATPVLFGAEQTNLLGMHISGGAISATPRNPAALGEFVPHDNFVGRTWELATLGRALMHAPADKVAAQITGMAGMGKTALAAEVVDVWQSRFDWLLLFQAKPNEIPLESFFRQAHMVLNGHLARYHQHIQSHPADAIWREQASFAEPARHWPCLMQNLVRAMQDEAILLVLDNFETHLQTQPEPGGKLWACKDLQWDQLLFALAQGLAGSRSRLLVTCRRPLTALAGPSQALATQHVQLGPLPAGEARLYLFQHPKLCRMLHGEDDEIDVIDQIDQIDDNDKGQPLARRLLQASRFHPLLMDRLARLATQNMRPRLLQVLELLEQRSDFAALPALFASAVDAAQLSQEQSYLQDALSSSIDLMLQQIGADARRLLWIVSLANEPLEPGILLGAWYGESHERQNLRELRYLLARFAQLEPDLQERLQALPPEVHEDIANLPEPPARAAPQPLLDHLRQIGLIHEQDGNVDCHELVRERCLQWMDKHPEDCAGLDATQVWQAFIERLLAGFEDFQYQNMALALQAGSRGLVYCVQTHDFDMLASYANTIVTATTNPRFLSLLLPHLHAAASKVPEGRARWLCLATLGDALSKNEQSDQGIGFYQQAHDLALAVATAGGAPAKQAWGDVGAIQNNHAMALRDIGQLDASRLCLEQCIEAGKQADSTACEMLIGELELLRLAMFQEGDISPSNLQQLLQYRAQVAAWWQQQLAVQPLGGRYNGPSSALIADAPDSETLARLYMNVLEAIGDAHFAQPDWPAALEVIEAAITLKRQLQRPPDDIAGSLTDRANILRNLGRLQEAKTELEACYDLYGDNPIAQTRVISSLGRVFEELADYQQALQQERRVLAMHEYLLDPVERAISHNNMANYLAQMDGQISQAESACHLLAALVYRWAGQLHQHCQVTLGYYARDFRRAHLAQQELYIPRLEHLLQLPSFALLEQWLEQRELDLAALQAELDVILEITRGQALASADAT